MSGREGLQLAELLGPHPINTKPRAVWISVEAPAFRPVKKGRNTLGFSLDQPWSGNRIEDVRY